MKKNDLFLNQGILFRVLDNTDTQVFIFNCLERTTPYWTNMESTDDLETVPEEQLLQTTNTTFPDFPLIPPDKRKLIQEKYGTISLILVHTIPDIQTCTKHASNLVDIDLVKENSHRTTFLPLEFDVKKKKPIFINQESIDFRIAKYITEVFNQPLDLTTELIIGNYLSNKLDDKYISPRGEQRNLEILLEDLKVFYKDAHNFDITKKDLAYIFRSLSHSPYNILLVALFQRIPPADLASYLGTSTPRYEIFDQRVRSMFQKGLSMHKIAQTLNVNHEVVRQVLLGTYDRPKNCGSKYKCQRWNWEEIDNNCCRDFYSKVSTIDKKKVSKPTVARLFDLKDKTLRNLPKLNSLIREYKNKNQSNFQ